MSWRKRWVHPEPPAWKGRGISMRVLAFLALFAVAALPAAAQSTSGASALQYYVGSWSCTGQATGQPPTRATLTYTMDSNVLHQTIDAPKMGKMKQAYYSSNSTTYDAKSGRYLVAGVSNDPASWASMWTLSGNVETGRDLWVSAGKPGRSQTVRNSSSMFTYTGYDTMASTKPSFKATCRKSS